MFDKKVTDFNSASEPSKDWVFLAHDQLNDSFSLLQNNRPLLLIENHRYFSRRPYHKQKLALVLTNQRNFALEQAQKGRRVRYLITESSYEESLIEATDDLEPESLTMMEAAERELRAELAGLIEAGDLKTITHEGWLTSAEDMDAARTGNKWRMDRFYQHVRKRTGILMDAGSPRGGKYSFDPDNRKPWHGEPSAPTPPSFAVDDLKQAVLKLIATRFARHPGTLDESSLPASLEEIEQYWQWCLDNCMENFGPYEDAMSTKSTGIFHTRISSLMNLHRLLPSKVVHDVSELDISLNSKEGFIRQVLGWREFVYQIHRVTDGFRKLQNTPCSNSPGDGGYSNWSKKAWIEEFDQKPDPGVDGGACPDYFNAETPLPAAYWGEKSGLNCLDTVVANVWAEGYSHHITRLMVLSNIATLLDISPRQLTDWFWVAYSDAWDWVVEPNVLGMGTHSTGDLMTTKPYVAGSNYINNMSDFCGGCKFNPKKNCPISRLYWAFLNRHRSKLEETRRLFMPLNSLGKRSDADKELDSKTFSICRKKLLDGDALAPEDFR